MAASTDPYAAALARGEREVGALSGAQPGPTLIAIGGMHGNEPAGVQALLRVFAELDRAGLALRGRFVGLLGNIGALRVGRRYLDTDLNRLWGAEDVRAARAAQGANGSARAAAGVSDAAKELRAALAPRAAKSEILEQRAPPAEVVEQRALRAEVFEQRALPTEVFEQRALLDAIEREIARASGPVVLLDMHSTSGDGPPFTITGNTSENRRLVDAIGVPSILGLQKNVRGTLLDLFDVLQRPAIVLEGGQNTAPSTVEHHESALWLLLQAVGLLERLPPGERERHRERLDRLTRGLPGAVEICMRYGIDPGERFRMEPGYSNFQRVEKGELLARSGERGEREIRCPLRSILLMPLYQGQGTDGFFLALAAEPAHSKN
jgi:predicted deacylase